jgi:RimJ/RimL family protein N-acetyltransferase
MPHRPPARILTPRLLLRRWQIRDSPALVEALTESVDHLLPWIPWATAAPPTRHEAEMRLRIWRDEFAEGTNFVYAALDRKDDSLVGGVGLYPRIGRGGLEIGYWIRLSRAGAGLAGEATRALTRAGFGVDRITRLEIHCDPKNDPSRRIPERLGYRLVSEHRERRPDGTMRDVVVYRITRREYDASDLSGRRPTSAERP